MAQIPCNYPRYGVNNQQFKISYTCYMFDIIAKNKNSISKFILAHLSPICYKVLTAYNAALTNLSIKHNYYYVLLLMPSVFLKPMSKYVQKIFFSCSDA